MKQILFLVLFALLTVPCSAQENKSVPNNEPLRYSYNVSGTVFNAKSQPLPKMTVCFLTAVRPFDARIPCVKTDDNGKFSVGSYNIPDQYKVCASSADWLLTLVGDEKNRVICSNSLTFGAADESKTINLKFKRQSLKESRK